jgi:hypothetical protein
MREFLCQVTLIFLIFSWNEYCVGIVFIVMVVLWLTEEFGDTRGWGIIFPDEYLE